MILGYKNANTAPRTGTVAPTTIVPSFIGQVYIDTIKNIAYIAYGLSAGEWLPQSVGLLDYMGAYDASVNTYPTVGSGTGGEVLKGDLWIISVQGTLGGETVHVGDMIIANTDDPEQVAENWNHIQGNLSYVAEDSANKVTSVSEESTDIEYPSAKLLYDQLGLKMDKILYVPEDIANKETTALDTSTTKYPCNNVVKEAVDAKQDALGYIAEDIANKETTALDTSTTKYPCNNVVKEAVDVKQDSLGYTAEDVANRLTSFQGTPDDTHYISEKLAYDQLATKLDLNGDGSSLTKIPSFANFGNTIYGGTISDDLDVIVKTGFYTCYGTATGAPSEDYSWFVLHQNSNTGNTSATQRAIAYSTNIVIYERIKQGSVWGSWYAQVVAGDIPVKATGVEIDTGTDDDKFVTAKALADQTTFAKLLSPSFTTPSLGTPSSGNLANCSFPILNQDTTGNAATVTNFTPADGSLTLSGGHALIITTTDNTSITLPTTGTVATTTDLSNYLPLFISITTVDASTYELLESDYLLNVTYTATGEVTSLTLPTAQCVSGRVIIVKDAGFNAGTYSITIDTEAGEKIDNEDTYVISSDGDSITLYSDGNNWFII